MPLVVSYLAKQWKNKNTSMPNLFEKLLFWLPHHSSFRVGGILQPRYEGPGAEGQTIPRFVVPSLMDSNERSAIQNHSGEKERD